jgi:PAS domain S-box-containing protein
VESLEPVRLETDVGTAAARYQAIFDALDEAVIVHDAASGKVVEMNREASALFGYAPEECRQLKFADFWAEAPAGEASPEPPALAGASQPVVRKMKDRNGRRFWAEMKPRPLALDGRQEVVTVIKDFHDCRPAGEGQREDDTYRLAAEGALAGVYVIQDHVLVYINPMMAEIFGYEREEILSGAVEPKELVHPDDLAWVRDKIQQRLSGQLAEARYTFRGLRKDGAVVYCECFGRAVNYRGRAAVLGTLLDITDRRAAEEALRKSEERYRAIVEDQAEFVTRFLPDTTVTFVNEASACFFGLTREQLVGQRFLQILPEEERLWVIENIHRLTAENPIATIEHRVNLPDGRIGWTQWTNRALYDEQGRLVEYQAVGRDITAHKRAEEALQAQKDLLSTVISATPDLLVLKDRDLVYRMVNPAFCRLLDLPEEEILGKTDVDLFPQPEAERYRADDLYVMATGASLVQDEAVTGENGRRWFQVIKTPIAGEDGSRGGVLCSVREITARRRFEEALQESEARYRIVTEGSLAGVYLIQGGKFRYINPVLAGAFGYRPEEIIDILGPLDLVSPENRPEVDKRMQVRLSGEEGPAYYGFTGARKDGSPIYCEVMSRAVDYKGGKALLGTLLDVTERRRAEEALKASEAKYRSIFEAVNDALAVVDLENGDVLEINPRALEMTGYRGGEVQPLNIFDVCSQEPPFTVSEAREWVRQAIQEGPQLFEWLAEDRRGRRFWVEVNLKRTQLAGQDRLLVVFRDISARKQVEQIKRKTQADLERRVEARTAWLKGANTQLLKEIEERQRADEMIRLQRDLALTLSGGVGLEEALRLCLETCLIISEMDGGGIYLIDPDSGDIDLKCHQGLSPRFVQTVSHYDADSLNAHVINASEPVYSRIQDLPGLLDEPSLLHEGLRSIAIIPMVHQDRVIACINVASRKYEEIPVTARVMLEAVAAQVGSAIARIKTEEALRESRVRFRAFMDHLPGVAFMMDHNNRQVYLNQNLESLLKELPHLKIDGHFVGKTNDEIWPPELADKFNTENLMVVTRRESFTTVEAVDQADGQHVWLLHKFPIMVEDGAPILVGGIGIDITELKQAEQALRQAKEELETRVEERTAQLSRANAALHLELQERQRIEASLRESEAKYRALVEQIPAITFIAALDDVQRHLYISPQIESVLEFTQEEWLATPELFRRQLHPDDRNRVLSELLLSYSQAGPFNSEYRMISKSGRVVWIRDQSRAVFDHDGHPLFLQGIALDITASKQAEEALQAAHSQLQALIEASPLATASVDINGKVTSWNPAAERIFGWRREEVLGRPLPQIPDDEKKEHQMVIRRILKGEQASREVCRVRKDGRMIDVRLNTALLHDAGGAITGIMGVMEDITAHRQTEQALRESEARYRAIFQEAPIGLARLNLQLQIYETNPALQKLLGYSDAEMRQMSPKDLTHPEDWEADLAPFTELLAGKSNSYQIEKRFIHKDGQTVWARLSVAMVRATAGDPQFVISMVEDITHRKRAEAAAEAIRRQQEAILNNIEDLVWLKDKESRFIKINEAFARIYGLKPDDLQGKTSLPVWPGELVQKYLEDDSEVMRTGIKKRVEEPLINQDGNLSWMETIKSPIFNERHEVVGTTGIARDITARRRMEAALQKVSRALKAITECHKAMQRAVSESELLEDVCRIIVEEGGYRMAWVGEMSPGSGETVRPVAQKGFEDGYLKIVKISATDSPRGRGPVGTAIRTGQPAVCRNTQKDPAFILWRREAKKRGYSSVLALPLKTPQTIGALAIYATAPDAFDDEEIELLLGLSNDLAYGITALRTMEERRLAEEALRDSEQKLRLLTSQLLSVQEGERRRISRELHDELGQALTVLKIQLASVQDRLRGDQEDLKSDCERLFGYIDGVIENVRRLSWDLSPYILEDLGLSSSLRYLINEICLNHKIDSKVVIDRIDHLFNPETKINIYRIFQESLTNIARHAQASQIKVSIEKQVDKVCFMVQDNGCGFEKDKVMLKPLAQRGLGLTAMRERSLMAKGGLQILTRTGQGTKVTFMIPIDQREKR